MSGKYIYLVMIPGNFSIIPVFMGGARKRTGFMIPAWPLSLFHHLRHLCLERINLGQKFLICSELAEHHWLQPWSCRSFKTGFLHPGQVLFISSLKNSTVTPQWGQTISKIESKPHSSVLFPEHLLIAIQCSYLVGKLLFRSMYLVPNRGHHRVVEAHGNPRPWHCSDAISPAWGHRSRPFANLLFSYLWFRLFGYQDQWNPQGLL